MSAFTVVAVIGTLIESCCRHSTAGARTERGSVMGAEWLNLDQLQGHNTAALTTVIVHIRVL